jgi:hypothetical protein
MMKILPLSAAGITALVAMVHGWSGPEAPQPAVAAPVMVVSPAQQRAAALKEVKFVEGAEAEPPAWTDLPAPAAGPAPRSDTSIAAPAQNPLAPKNAFTVATMHSGKLVAITWDR